MDSKFECIYFLFSNGLYFFAYSGCARTNFDLSNLLHVTILLESLSLKIRDRLYCQISIDITMQCSDRL